MAAECVWPFLDRGPDVDAKAEVWCEQFSYAAASFGTALM